VKRATRTLEELERPRVCGGRILLAQNWKSFSPRVVAFNGKQVYEKFAQRPGKFGLQKGKLYGAQVFVLPATSGQSTGRSGVTLRYFRKLAELLHRLPD